MKSLSLRFSEKFAPDTGTIEEHKNIIDKYGYVWYGKLGNAISDKVKKEILAEKESKVLLIHSGSVERYWAKISDIQKEQPDLKYVPEYYHDKASKIKAWIKITKIEVAEKDVMSKCIVVSSKNVLSQASKYSMNPCLFIEYEGE